MGYLVLVLLFASCMPSAGPRLPEVSHRQQKLLRASFAEVWRAAHGAIDETRLRVTEDDEAEGTIRLSMRRQARTQSDDLERELTRIAEIDKARRSGLRRLSEYLLEYTVAVAPLGDRETRLDVSTQIVAIDRSEVIWIPPGIAQVVPRSFEVPSKGVLERDLVTQIADRLFLSEEMLYFLGMLGRD